MKSIVLVFAVVVSLTACTRAGVNNPASTASNLNTQTVDVPPPTVPAQIPENPTDQAQVSTPADVLKENCVKKADDDILSSDQIDQICGNANEYSQNCMVRALQLGMLRDDVATVCENARQDTVDCIVKGRDADKYSEEIADICKTSANND